MFDLKSNLWGKGALALSIVLAALSGVLREARADIVVEYNFGPTAPASPGNPAPNTVGVGFSATNIGVTPGASGLVSVYPGATAYGSEPIFTLDNVPLSAGVSEAAALASGSYFSFSVDKTATGGSYDLDSLSFIAGRGGASTPRAFYVYSSIDGFTAGNAISVQAIPTVRPTSTPYNFALGPQFDGLTSSVEFRIYGTVPLAGNQLDFDNVLLQGQLNSVVPEPASIFLFATVGAVAGGVMWRRRRRS